MTLAQDGGNNIDWVPLNKFKRGVNTSGVYGNWFHAWTPGPQGKMIPYNTPWGIGFDSTNPTRIAALLQTQDFQMMAEIPSGEPIFDHVIFNLDPHTFGANPVTGTIPSPLSTVFVDGTMGLGGNSVQANFQALVEDIAEARAHGLAVVLAMHATAATPASAAKWRADNQSKWSTTLREYPGPFKVHLYTRGTLNQNHAVNASHPLPNFWRSFVGHLVDVMEAEEIELGSDIAFRLGGESLANFTSKDTWSQTCAPFFPGQTQSAWNTQIALGDAPFRNSMQPYVAWAKSEYRQIEFQAIKAIWGDHPETKVCRILASPGEPWPIEFGMTQQWPSFGAVPSGLFDYQPYSIDEMQEVDNIDYAELAGRIGYVMHMYEPFPYTHSRSSYVYDEVHRRLLRYQGKEGGGVLGRTWVGPRQDIGPGANPDWTIYDRAAANAGNSVFAYNDYVLKALTNPQNEFWPNTTDPVIPFISWHDSNGNPPMLVSEFGVNDLDFADGLTGEIPSIPFPGESAPPNARLMRARYIYDVRTWFELRGIGWSIWDCWDSFPSFRGTLQKRNPDGTWDLQPTSRYTDTAHGNSMSEYPQFFWYIGEALFGETRP